VEKNARTVSLAKAGREAEDEALRVTMSGLIPDAGPAGKRAAIRIVPSTP